jgi:hypothetical protein
LSCQPEHPIHFQQCRLLAWEGLNGARIIHLFW